MIESIFSSFSRVIENQSIFAFAACFFWGILSILLSPCHLASIPLIVGFIGHQGRINKRRAFLISLFFSSGILLTISIIGIITSLAGKMLGNVGPAGDYLVVIVFFIVGLLLLDVIEIPWSVPAVNFIRKKNVLTAFVLGLIFGVALGPCTFAYLAPLMAIVFDTGGTNFLYGAALLVVYGLGHCAVIVFAGTFTEVVQQYMDWNEISGVTVAVKRVCGMLVIAAGLYILYIS